VTGALMISQGLSLEEALAAILIGNLLGCPVVGLASIMGPRTGTTGIITSRTSFGQVGALLPTFVSTVSAVGWFSINSVVATESLVQAVRLVGAPPWIAIDVAAMLAVLAAEILIAVYGHATIIAAERYVSVVLLSLFLGFAALLVPRIDWSAPTVAAHGTPAAWLLAAGLIFSYPLSWANFASDYSRYLPAPSSWRRVAFAAAAGQFVALVLVESIGVLFALAVRGALADPIADLPKVLPAWYLGPFLLATILGSIATNVPNGYTAGLGLLALRLPIRRIPSMLLIGAATLVFRVFTLVHGHALDLYERWLGYILVWTGPWISIVVIDYCMRDGYYSGEDLMRWRGGSYWYGHGVRWQGMAAFLFGLAASLLFSNSDLYASPLMTGLLGGTDLSFEAGILASGALYYVLSIGERGPSAPFR
jgi:NCS1 family nucleobase:cation symporter-1